MDIEIRQTREEDYQGILCVLQAVGLAEEDWFTLDPFRRMLARNTELFFLAQTVDRHSFTIGTVFASDGGGYFGYIYKLAVLPPHQRQGVGTALLRKVIEKFRTLQINWYFGLVEKTNEASLGVLAKLGIRPQSKYIMVDNWPD